MRAPFASSNASAGAGLVMIPAGRARSNHAEVARSLGTAIITGRYAAGAKLPGDGELLAAFGVSRPVLRESVKTLVAKGLRFNDGGAGFLLLTMLVIGLSSAGAGWLRRLARESEEGE